MIVNGGHEFATPGTENEREPADVSNLLRAHAMMPYDLMLLSPSDELALKRTAGTAGKGWTGPLDKPEVVIKAVAEGSLAFVLFPDSGQRDAAAEDELVRVARDLRQSGRHNLVIGISTWGDAREMAFIEGSEPVFDIVLGSGPGPGYSGLYLQGNRVLWVRAFTKGKNLQAVTIPTLPAPGAKTVWEPEATITTRSLALDDSVPADPRVQAIFSP